MLKSIGGIQYSYFIWLPQAVWVRGLPIGCPRIVLVKPASHHAHIPRPVVSPEGARARQTLWSGSSGRKSQLEHESSAVSVPDLQSSAVSVPCWESSPLNSARPHRSLPGQLESNVPRGNGLAEIPLPLPCRSNHPSPTLAWQGEICLLLWTPDCPSAPFW